MIRFSLLGALDVQGSDGRQILSVLAQPKRIALLAYLAAGREEYVRRDTLLGVFWPSFDEEHARHALRQALYVLRRGLGPNVVTSRGDEELGVDGERLWCDVAAFEVAVEGDRPGEGLDLYKGDLLEGFFLSDAPEFEKWLDGRRASLRQRAAEAAWALADRAEVQADGQEAAQWARRAAEYAPDDESTLQRLVRLLDRAGDRAAALRAYEAFAWRLENELSLEPSPETRALIEEIRARETTGSMADAVPASVPDAASARDAAPLPGAGAAPHSASAPYPASEPRPKRRGLRLTLTAIAAGAAIVGAVFSALTRFGSEPGADDRVAAGSVAVELDPRRIAVLYFDDLSEGGGFDYYADGLTEWLIQALSQVQALEVISLSGVKPYRNTAVTVDSIVRALRGPGTLIEGNVIVSGDRIRVNVQMFDAATNTNIDSRTIERPRTDPLALLDDLTNEVSVFLRERLGEEIRIREARGGTESSEAWEYLQRASRAAEDAHIVAEEGNLDAARTAYERADNMFLEAESLDPEWLLPIVERGWVAFRVAWLGQPYPRGPQLLSGLQHAERAVERGLIDPRAFELRGTLQAYLGWHEPDPDRAAAHLESAEKDLVAAVDTDPSLARAWAQLSFVYIRTGRFQEARWAADRALEADAFLEEKESIWYWNGLAALQEEEIAAALQWATEGRQMYPRVAPSSPCSC